VSSSPVGEHARGEEGGTLNGYLNGTYGMNVAFGFLGLTLVACLAIMLLMPRPPVIRPR
jgi:hypothetical protein